MSSDSQSTNVKILVVEDERSSAILLKKLLEKCGYTVVDIVDSGENAVRIAGVLKPDLMLMDITLSGKIDGIEAAEKIFNNYKIPFIYITGGSDEVTFERVKKTMPLAYILKPYNIDMLKATIEMALYRFDIEQKLHESEKRNKDILAAIPDVMFKLDREANYLEKIDTVIAEKVWPESLKEKSKKVIAKVLDEDLIEIFDFALKKKDRVRYLEARIMKSDNDSVLVVLRDITGKKMAELKLKEYQENLENLVKERTEELTEVNEFLVKEIKLREQVEENLKVFSHTINQSSHSVVILDRDGKVEYVNQRYVNITGFSIDDLAGMSVIDGVNPVIPEPDIWETMTGGEEWKGEIYNLTKNGELYYIAARFFALKNDSGEITHYIMIGEDITQKRKEQMELEKVREALDKSKIDIVDMELDWREWKEKMLQRNISRTDKSLFRNINNSFTQGAGFGSLISLLEMLSSTAERQNGKQLVDNGIYELVMNNLHVAQEAFKTFANIDWIITNNFKLDTVSFRDVYNFVKAIATGHDELRNIKNHRILINELIYGYHDIYVKINKEYLYKAVYEGLLNAMKFSKPNTIIIVFVYMVNKNVVISIVNDPETGEDGIVGIPVEYSRVVFEPFYRLSKLVFERYKTLDFGLGLTLIEKIISKHGGEVLARNIMDHSDLKREPQTKVDLSISLPVVN